MPFNISPPALPLLIPGLRFMILHYICLVTLIHPSHRHMYTHMQLHHQSLYYPCLVHYHTRETLIFSSGVPSEVVMKGAVIRVLGTEGGTVRKR